MTQDRTARPFHEKVWNKTLYAFSFIYRKQLSLVYHLDYTCPYRERAQQLPPPYTLQSPDKQADLDALADLLNSDGDFGHWTGERIDRDYLQQLIRPDAATLLFHGKELIGNCGTIDGSSRRHKTGLIMWMIIRTSHRGKGLAKYLWYKTLNFFVEEHYDKILLTTDMSRLPAIRFYLCHQLIPNHESIYSHIQWRLTMKELGKFAC
ncbi:MAG: GNAT family N-acetyltransferase [Syntrophus sp. (in: bacteria)]